MSPPEPVPFDFPGCTPEQREVLASLTADELAVLMSIQERLEAAADVQVHGPLSVGVVVW